VTVLETDRLVLRRLSVDDAVFILELLNEPSWLRFIGDPGVRTLEDAESYLLKGPIEMYARHGFGLYLTALKADGVPMGMCGLVKREALDDIDIGFAFLPRFWGRGYAHEAAAAVMAHAKAALGLRRVVAIVAPDNRSSLKLLGKLGMRFERMVKLADGGQEIELFGRRL
jgi:RimJ/RimL family protein N-acetyltransferase